MESFFVSQKAQGNSGLASEPLAAEEGFTSVQLIRQEFKGQLSDPFDIYIVI